MTYMHQNSPLLLPVFFAAIIHLGLLTLLFSFNQFGGDSYFQQEDLSLVSVRARTVSLPVANPKVWPNPKPISKVEEKQNELQLEEPESIPQETRQETPVNEDIDEETAEVVEEYSPIKREDSEQLSASKRNEALAYYGRNKELVERNFYTGTGAQREQFEGLVTRLKIFLSESGELESVEIISGSGNELFDAETVRAVRRVNKFIIPDDWALRQRYFREIVMEFKLD